MLVVLYTQRVRVGFVDSGLGVIPTSLAVSEMVSPLHVVLSMDPEMMPWGPLTDDAVAQRALLCAEAAVSEGAEAIVLACNTASVLAIDVVRQQLEPRIPVIGTVPAIKPAAALGEPFAVWATSGTTGSSYQARLIREFAQGLSVSEIACPGLAEAIELGDLARVDASIKKALSETPTECRAIVLGCTQYPLVADRIRDQLEPDCEVFDSSKAVARQTIRRTGLKPTMQPPLSTIGLTVLLSGTKGSMPARAMAYDSTSRLIRSSGDSSRSSGIEWRLPNTHRRARPSGGSQARDDDLR